MIVYVVIIIILALNNLTGVTLVENDLIQTIINCDKIIITCDGEEKNYEQGSIIYDEVVHTVESMLNGCREMPAFGVALDNEVVVAKENGVWLEFVFNELHEYNGMMFESLLINVSPEFTGFNIMRKQSGKYDGRCYYVDLVNCDMSELYDKIGNIK